MDSFFMDVQENDIKNAENDLSDPRKLLIEYAGQLSLAAGAFLGGLVIGPLGSALGVILGENIKNLVKDFSERVFSDIETKRVEAVLRFTIEGICERLRKGDCLREDIFSKSERIRSDSEEILEGVLLSAKNEHEEKKAKIISNLYINFAFSESFSKAEANQLLKLCERLTYQQFCLLVIVKQGDFESIPQLGFEMSDSGYVTEPINPIENQVPIKKITLLKNLYDLKEENLLLQKTNTFFRSSWGPSSSNLVIDTVPYANPKDWTEINLHILILTKLGSWLFDCLDLSKSVQKEDIENILESIGSVPK